MDRTLRVLSKDTAWMILEELGKGNKTPTELASKFDMSVANVDNFLSKLEDKRIVKRVKKIRKGRGRPFTEYALEEKGPIFILMPAEGKRYYIEGSEEAAKALADIVKKHKGGLIKNE